MGLLACSPSSPPVDNGETCLTAAKYKALSAPCAEASDCPAPDEPCQIAFCDFDNTCAVNIPAEGSQEGCPTGLVCAVDGCCAAP